MTTAAKTKQTRLERNRAHGAAIKARFDYLVATQDPDEPFTHDANWNPKHPDYTEDPATWSKVDGEWESDEPAPAATPIAATKKRVAAAATKDTDAEDRREEQRLGLRRNKYAGDCELCHANVPADEGHIFRIDGRWQVRHRIACPAQEAKPAAAPKPAQEGLDLSSLPSGRYADPTSDGRLKVKIDNVTKPGRWHGYIFVKDAAEYGNGSRYGIQRPDGRYQGKIEEALEAILTTPAAALARYGQLTGTCGACGRRLEDEKSIDLGIGPVCRKKGLFG